MIDLITRNQQGIANPCRAFGVRKLEVFDSAATGTFIPGQRDIDFIADPGEYEPGVAKRDLRFARALEQMLQTPVAIITEEQISNPYFRQAVDEQRTTIHIASDREAAA